jgi:putative transposase
MRRAWSSHAARAVIRRFARPSRPAQGVPPKSKNLPDRASQINVVSMRLIDPDTGRSYVEKRRKRYDEIGQPRELTFSCYSQFPFLAQERTREWFREALEAARSKFGIQLWAYVIMPEHVHLLVYAEDHPERISAFLKELKEPVGRKAVAHLEKNAPKWLARITVREGKRTRRRFWQPGGGYDRNVSTSSTLRWMIDYIHANPVRRGLVQCAEDWEWSSARWYAGIRPVKIEMDKTILEELARG